MCFNAYAEEVTEEQQTVTETENISVDEEVTEEYTEEEDITSDTEETTQQETETESARETEEIGVSPTEGEKAYKDPIQPPSRGTVNGAGGQWVQVSGGYKFRLNGSYLTSTWILFNGNYYYVGSDQYRYTYYKSVGSDYYYFNGAGVMQTGWIQFTSNNKWRYFGSDGKMYLFWHKINSKWYYFMSDGYMKTGWLQDSETHLWYYLGSDGAMYTFYQEIDGDYYYFNSDGIMQTGWVNFGSFYRYFNESDGKQHTGWLGLSGSWYYLDSNGKMLKFLQTINGNMYYFNSSGVMFTGWLNFDEGKRYFGSDGKAYTYYQAVGSDHYYFNGAGIMQTGWIKFNSDQKWRYFDKSDGKQHIGWLQDEDYDNKWFYLDGNNNGIMATYNVTSGHKTYGFLSNGVFDSCILDVQRVIQIDPSCCWAASAVMVGTYNTSSTVTQQYIRDHNFLYPLLDGGTVLETKRAVRIASENLKNGHVHSSFTFTNVINEIDYNRPFIMILDVTGYSMHAVVVAGYKLSTNEVFIQDPYQPDDQEELDNLEDCDRTGFHSYNFNSFRCDGVNWRCKSVITYTWSN